MGKIYTSLNKEEMVIEMCIQMLDFIKTSAEMSLFRYISGIYIEDLLCYNFNCKNILEDYVMDNCVPSKIVLLKIWEILCQETDEDTPLSSITLLDKLNEIYG